MPESRPERRDLMTELRADFAMGQEEAARGAFAEGTKQLAEILRGATPPATPAVDREAGRDGGIER